jgi:type VII secretion-associated serine protease mycosin
MTARWRSGRLSLLSLLLLASFVLGQAPAPIGGQAGKPEDFEPGAVLVRFWPEVSVAAQASQLQALGATAVDEIPELGLYKLRVPVGRERAVAARLRSTVAEYAEVNYIRRASFTPNDTFYGSQWNLTKIQTPSAWDITTGDSQIVVAVIDTGLDLSHPDRPQNITPGPDYIADHLGNTLVSADPHGHGTHVAGILAARTNNGTGVAGVAPGVTIMPIRVLDASGSGTTYDTARAISYAADHGARIINLSLAGFSASTSEKAAVDYAYSKGVLIIAAAGNCYAGGSGCNGQVNPILYPAAFEHVLAVGATTKYDEHAAYSEAGCYVDLAAPGGSGGDILSTWPSSKPPYDYAWLAGTSMASPHVAGVAALVWSLNPQFTSQQVEDILRSSAEDLGATGRDDFFGYGRVNAYQALKLAQERTASPSLPIKRYLPTLEKDNAGGC